MSTWTKSTTRLRLTEFPPPTSGGAHSFPPHRGLAEWKKGVATCTKCVWDCENAWWWERVMMITQDVVQWLFSPALMTVQWIVMLCFI